MNFDFHAKTYDSHAQIQQNCARWLGEWLDFIDVPANKIAQEIAAGTGFFTEELARRGFKIRASDASPQMVERGKNRVPAANWQVADARDVPANSCDLLCSSSFLQWAKNPAELLENWRAALRGNGQMLHGIFVAPTLGELYSLLEPRSREIAWRTEAEWLAIFERAGFRILRAESRIFREPYPSALALLRSLKFTGTTSAGTPNSLPAGTLRQLLRDYESRFSCGNENSRGNAVFATWKFCRILAGTWE